MHVNGLSWDVLKPLALALDLHPLSLEDILHSSSSSSTRSKVDYFRQHLFCSVIVHRTLEQGNKEIELPEDPTSVSRSTTRALGKKKAASKDRGGVRAFGFHSHHRDEEAIVDSVVLPPPPASLVPSSQTSLGGHSLVPSQDGSGLATPLAVHAKSYSQYRRNLREAFKGVKRDKEGESPRTLSHNRTGLSTRLRGGKRSKQSKKEEERAAARWTVAALTKDVKVHVRRALLLPPFRLSLLSLALLTRPPARLASQIHVEQLSCFLLRDGTVLSVSQDQGYHHQISNLFERINMRDDILRESEDASFVLQALLDVTADDALEIVDEFREQLTTLESRVLSRPDMDDVRVRPSLSSSPFPGCVQRLTLSVVARAAPPHPLVAAHPPQVDPHAAPAPPPGPALAGRRQGGRRGQDRPVARADALGEPDGRARQQRARPAPRVRQPRGEAVLERRHGPHGQHAVVARPVQRPRREPRASLPSLTLSASAASAAAARARTS